MTNPRLQLPPLALYIHIPWCVRKCPYCDFNSHTQHEALPEQAYVAALLADLEQDLPAVQGRPISSIFIGGGTPSLFSADAFATLFEGLWQRLQPTADIEITLEANPGTFEQERFAAYRQLGINRLSLGVQSFQDEKLKALGRIHSAAEAVHAIEAAGRAGFDNLNIDLMHGLPEQSLEDALYDLDQALSLQPTHLSWYQLTIEPNTFFWNKPPQLPEDEALWAIQEAGQERLAEAGFAQYEVSGYSRPGQRCRHNLNYWQFGDFIGIGAGAHGKLTDLERSKIRRTWKHRAPQQYLAADTPFLSGARVLDADELPIEYMLNALRLIDGVPVTDFCARTGLALDVLAPALSEARQRGLLELDPTRLQASALGARYLNNLLECFMA